MPMENALSEGHEVLGSEYCSGYTDGVGKWNTGFYCPSSESALSLYCCGTSTNKYCCARKEHTHNDDFSSLPLLLGVVMGVVAAVIIVTLISCCLCSCCFLFKKRQINTNGGPLYRLHCSSTASGVANMYSFSTQNSTTSTPITTAVVELEPDSPRGRAMGCGHTFSKDICTTLPPLLPLPADRSPTEEDDVSRSEIHSTEPPPPYDSPCSYAYVHSAHSGSILGSTFGPLTNANIHLPLQAPQEENGTLTASSSDNHQSEVRIVGRPGTMDEILYHSTKF